jgi:hypothetical protein
VGKVYALAGDYTLRSDHPGTLVAVIHCWPSVLLIEWLRF